MHPILRTGKVSSGRTWKLKLSEDSALTEGTQYVIFFEEPEKEVPSKDRQELIALAYALAEELTIEPDRFRVAMNGQKVASWSNMVHVHILCLAGQDKLPKLTQKFTG